MSTLSTAVDLGEEMVLDPSELKKLKLTGVNEEELAEALYQRLQGRLPTKLFDKTTENLLQEGIVLEDGLASVYDKLALKMAEMLKERMFERLKNFGAGDEKEITEENFSVSEEIPTVQDVDSDADIIRTTSYGTQNCAAKTLKRKVTGVSTRNVKMRPLAPNLEPVIHVLLIDHVLDTIFENFVLEGHGPTNLVNFRLVCRVWNQRATEALRKIELEIIFEGNDFELEGSDSKLRLYMQTMENSSLIPFRCYSLKLGILPFTLDVNLVQNFLQTFGPDAVALKFHFGTQFSLPLEIYSANFNLTNMERLEIYFREPYFCPPKVDHEMNLESGSGQFISNETGIPQFIIKLLTEGPKLRVFGVREKAESRICAPEILEWIPKTVKDLRLNIRTLVAPHFSALAERNLQLLKFSLGYLDYESILGNLQVNYFFRMQDKSLTSLKLNELAMSTFSNNFFQLENLRSLTLEFNRFRPLDISISDAFPNLRVLKLETKLCNFANLILLSDNLREVVTSVEELHLPDHAYDQQEANSTMKLLSKRFPNVKKLFVCLHDKETLRSICTYYTEIEELHLLRFGGGVFVNNILFGASDEICALLLHNSNFRIIDLEGVLRPTLLNLTKLKKLDLNSFPNRCATLIDMSAQHIFLKMASLKELIIPESFKISPCYMDQLQASVKIFYCQSEIRASQNHPDDEFSVEYTYCPPRPNYNYDVSPEIVESSLSSDSD